MFHLTRTFGYNLAPYIWHGVRETKWFTCWNKEMKMSHTPLSILDITFHYGMEVWYKINLYRLAFSWGCWQQSSKFPGYSVTSLWTCLISISMWSSHQMLRCFSFWEYNILAIFPYLKISFETFSSDPHIAMELIPFPTYLFVWCLN